MKIKAVIFDLDDTLYDYSRLNDVGIKNAAAYAKEELHCSEEEFLNCFEQARKDIKKILKGTAAEHNRLLYFQKTLELLGFSGTYHSLELYNAYWDYLLEHMRLKEGAIKLLDFCVETKRKVGICSDLTVHIQQRKLRKLDICQYVDKLVTSEEAGAEKPNGKMFSLILEKLDILPMEAVFVGDSRVKDIDGAIQAGICPIWLSSELDNSYSGYQVRNLVEIKDIINELERN